MMKNRSDIKDFILQIERQFPVNQWKAGGVHLWPWLRIRLFFHLINVTESENFNPESRQPKSTLNAIIRKKLRIAVAIPYYLAWLRSLPKKKYLFFGVDAHRVVYKGKKYNRYFDTLIEKYGISSQSMIFEYEDLVSENLQHHELIFRYHKAYRGFRAVYRKKPDVALQLEGFREFVEFLASNNRTTSFAKKYSEAFVKRFLEHEFFPKVAFFRMLIRKIKPQRIAILCYYSEDMLALTLAANLEKVETIDMQHGPETEIHLCYGNWSSVPKTGYALLPRIFWCWDSYSQSVVRSWAGQSDFHQAIVSGNPWVDYWKQRSVGYNFSNYILYSLQPLPLTVAQLFPPELVKVILADDFTWFIRLHPRQLSKKDDIIRFLKEKGIFELVNIENATNDPLPLLLMNARLHVTHFSGTAIEAAQFNVYTVLLNQTALASFPNLVEEEKARFIDPASQNFQDAFKKVVAERASVAGNFNFESQATRALF